MRFCRMSIDTIFKTDMHFLRTNFHPKAATILKQCWLFNFLEIEETTIENTRLCFKLFGHSDLHMMNISDQSATFTIYRYLAFCLN